MVTHLQLVLGFLVLLSAINGLKLPHQTSNCRCLPNSDCWPEEEVWRNFNATIDGQLVVPSSPVSPCLDGGLEEDPETCTATLQDLGKDPFLLQTLPGGTESTGQMGAWTALPSAFTVAALKPDHIVHAVNFARDHNLRLVVKATGHDYYGRSSAPDSLQVRLEPGLTWMDVYAQATERNLYVEGGA